LFFRVGLVYLSFSIFFFFFYLLFFFIFHFGLYKQLFNDRVLFCGSLVYFIFVYFFNSVIRINNKKQGLNYFLKMPNKTILFIKTKASDSNLRENE
ncbi:hypothetical protein, partial [Proteus mirabilis]|uniref:hypothetical protein n=1 Tax=Proteus mirabilis TaxID=584 RepID=UPI0030C6BD6C